MRILLLIMTLFLTLSCKKSEQEEDKIIDSDYIEFTSMNHFLTTIQEIASDTSASRLKKFVDSLKVNNQVPFVFNDSVTFIYYGSADNIQWAGDFNNWQPGGNDFNGEKIGSKLWICTKNFPIDARLDYKIVMNNSSWILDPLNGFTQYSGFGPNSELRMPEWVFPEETKLMEGVIKGTLSENIIISSSSENLGYNVQYKVYTPYNYEQQTQMPVIYVTDGHEYSDDRLGAMVTVLDNLIYKQQIEPVIAVFIDPRDPANNSNNRRLVEYRTNQRFAAFVSQELVPLIDQNYKTINSPEHRAILGTSYGGWNSAYFGLTQSETFRLIGMHSPAFDQSMINSYSNTGMKPLKIYMSTGTINDTEDRSRLLKAVLEDKGYIFQYKEVNEGHSWGNWKGLIDEPLIFFFGNSKI